MGNRYSREELRCIEALVEEGLTSRDIAERLGRSEAGIRNLRYRKSLIRKAEDETKALLQRRNQLRQSVFALETKLEELQLAVQELEGKKERVEQFLELDKNQLELVLTEALKTLKWKKPELFTLSGPEQFVMLLRLFSKLSS